MPEQGRIQLLDPIVASQIAAGEVVERPSSVVKELMENAIDAGATFITLEIAQGGNSLIRISDNGKGILREDIPLAFARHATSKLRSASELYDLPWMGFRGEALYSISAVSKVTLLTKRREDEMGTRAVCEGGELGKLVDAGCPDGTIITVEDLFFNVPARKKFMKTAHAEAGYVSSVVAKMILSHPHISIKFIHDGKVVYHSSGDDSLRNAVHTVYGKNVSASIVEIHDEMSGVTIDGCLGLPAIARANRQQENFFVNGRAIQSPILSRAVENGYGTALMTQRFPFCVLDIRMPGAWVDVNVHPNKLQVRFTDEGQVFRAVNGMIASAVRKMTQKPVDFTVRAEPVPDEPEPIKVPERSTLPLPELAKALSQQSQPVKNPAASAVPVPEARPAAEKAIPKEEPAPETQTQEQVSLRDVIRSYREQAFVRTENVHRGYQDILRTPSQPSVLRQDKDDVKLPVAKPEEQPLPDWDDDAYRIIGVAFHTYVILEAGEKLIWIDQHAAHERLLFDRYCAQLSGGQIASQQLLIPQVIEVSYDEKTSILENLEALEQAGFQIEEYGRLSFTIRALPQVLGQIQAQELIINLLQVLERKDYPDREAKNQALAQMACKRAVKAGDTLDEREIKELYRLILQEKIPLTCPHGRPICMIMTQKDMEKQFKRVVT